MTAITSSTASKPRSTNWRNWGASSATSVTGTGCCSSRDFGNGRRCRIQASVTSCHRKATTTWDSRLVVKVSRLVMRVSRLVVPLVVVGVVVVERKKKKINFLLPKKTKKNHPPPSPPTITWQAPPSRKPTNSSTANIRTSTYRTHGTHSTHGITAKHAPSTTGRANGKAGANAAPT